MTNSNSTKNKKSKNSLYEKLLVQFDQMEKLVKNFFDDLLTHENERGSRLVGICLRLFSKILAGLLRQEGRGFLFFISSLLKRIVGVFLIVFLFIFFLIPVLILGSISSTLGLRNLGEYSLKEQLAAFVIVFLLLGFAPLVLSNYALFRLSLVMVFVLGVIGLDFLYGQCGIISLAHGGFLLTSGYLVTWLYQGAFGFKFPLLISIFVGAMLNGIIGILFGIPALRVKDHYLVVVSLAFTLVIPTLLKSQHIKKMAGVSEGGLFIDDLVIPEFLNFWSVGIWKYFFVAIPVVILVFFAYNLLYHSQVRRAFKAIKCDDQLTEIFGVPVIRYKLLAFCLSGIFAGFAGGFFVTLTKFISPESYSLSSSIDFVVANVIGGTGIFGAVIGGTYLAFDPDITQFITRKIPQGKDIARAIYGVILIIVTLFYPLGIAGQLSSFVKRRYGQKGARGNFLRNPPPDFDYLKDRKKYFEQPK